MISAREAKVIAGRYLGDLELSLGTELVLLDEATLEREFGWVFFYNSRAWFETGSFSDCLAGNAPIIVERASGEVHETGTAHPVEYYLAEFEKAHLV